MASKLLPRCLKIATWAQLGPTWLHLGLILCFQEAPRGAQEASKTPPRGSKRPPRGPRSPIVNIKMSILRGRGCIFLSYPLACNMSPLGSRRGPALRAESGGVRPLCRIPLGLIPQSWPLRSIRGPRHSADPVLINEAWPLKVSKTLQRGAIFQHKGHAMLT